MTKIVAFVPDLMDRSRFSAVSGVEFVVSAEALSNIDADVVVADLSRPGALQAMSVLSDSVRRVGFVPHVESELRVDAQAAGIEVHARSKFFRDLTAILAEKTTESS